MLQAKKSTSAWSLTMAAEKGHLGRELEVAQSTNDEAETDVIRATKLDQLKKL